MRRYGAKVDELKYTHHDHVPESELADAHSVGLAVVGGRPDGRRGEALTAPSASHAEGDEPGCEAREDDGYRD